MAVAEKEASQGAANQKPITTHGIQTRASGGIHGIHSAVPTRKKKKNQTETWYQRAHVWRTQAVYFTLIWFWYSRTPFVSAPAPIKPLQCSLKP
jgi:hypothetical protein